MEIWADVKVHGMKRFLPKCVVLAILLCQLCQAQDYQPAASFYSLLKLNPSVKNGQALWSGGVADILFAPAEDFAAKVVVRSGDKVLAEYPARIEQRVGSVARIRWKHEFVPLGNTPGPRSVEFLVNNKVCGRLDFQLVAGGSGGGDAFDQKPGGIEIDGPWSNVGRFFYESDPANQQRVHFEYWSRSGELKGPAKGMLDLVMRRGDKVLATARARETSYPEYIRKDNELVKADGKVLTAKDLPGMSGPFVLELKFQGKVIKSYRGSIADGKFVDHPRSDLNLADRTNFLSPREMSDGGGSLSTQVYTWVTTD